MTYFVDSHCHLNMLDLSPYDGDLDRIVDAARGAGVQTMLNIGVDLVGAQAVIDTAQRYAGVYASAGVHPHDSMDEALDIEKLRALASQEKVVAIGETGLDYHYHETGHDAQQRAFAQQIALANELDLPLIIHTRDAKADTLRLLKEGDAKQAVLHCFTEDWAMAKAGLDMGFYVSISGIVTFKNAAQVQEVASKVPLDRLLIETDAPYLAPVPYRGKKNEPKHVVEVAAFIANLRGIAIEALAVATADNFHRLFAVPRGDV